MQAGLLRHLVNVLAPASQTQDANGEPTIVWATIATVWARISPKDGRALALAQIPTTNLTATHEIEIRRLAALTAECRIQFGTRTFTINSIRNVDERNIRQLIVATELV